MLKIIALLIISVFITASSAVALQINDDAPLFSLRDSNGDFFHLSNFIGNKKKETVKGLIVNFCSSLCKPCKKELPVLNSLVDEFNGKGIKVIIIGYKEDFDIISEMLDSIRVNKPVVLSDPYGKIGGKYGVYGLPLTIFINAHGKVQDIIKGEVPNIGNVLRDKAARLIK
jgi:thiol-disulfide isomerase/thioredoxin